MTSTVRYDEIMCCDVACAIVASEGLSTLIALFVFLCSVSVCGVGSFSVVCLVLFSIGVSCIVVFSCLFSSLHCFVGNVTYELSFFKNFTNCQMK